MWNYIQFWLAKGIAEVMTYLALLAALGFLFLLIYLSDKPWRKKR
jgi:hypothetical protein